ncbi:MAG: glycosyltransferase family 9 protein [Alphaproteobacteria bacterium]
MRFDPKKILIILHGSIGDVTRALPLAGILRSGFPQAHLAWAVEPPSLPLVARFPAVQEVMLFDRRRWWREWLPFLRRVRAARFDLVLDLQRHFKSGVISRWSGAPIRVGFHRRDAKELNWLFNNHYIPAVGDGISKLSHYLKFAEYLGLHPSPVDWKFQLTVEEEQHVDKFLAAIKDGFAALFVGSRWESKRWFPAQAAECARTIKERHRCDVVLLGGKEDRSIATEILGMAGVPITNLVGQTTLAEALGVVARATFAVGPDTGLMHVAAAVGTPVVSLWGATSPIRTGPYNFEDLVIQGKAPCAPCYRRQCPIGRVCMQSIAIEEIGEKIALALSRSRKKDACHVSDG